MKYLCVLFIVIFGCIVHASTCEHPKFVFITVQPLAYVWDEPSAPDECLLGFHYSPNYRDDDVQLEEFMQNTLTPILHPDISVKIICLEFSSWTCHIMFERYKPRIALLEIYIERHGTAEDGTCCVSEWTKIASSKYGVDEKQDLVLN